MSSKKGYHVGMIDIRNQILENKNFEHLEVEPLITFPNPPVRPFNPTAPTGSEKTSLKLAHSYAIAWMNSRLEYGGGVIGDQMGMGKTVQSLTWIALRKEKMGSKGPIALIITYDLYHG
jgi:SNF2 family DNA or RNA helicase